MTRPGLPPAWLIAWEERAAIMEFEGGMPREAAERAALVDVRRQMELANRYQAPEAPPRRKPA